MNDETANLPASTDDGFDDQSDNDRLLQGSRLACVDGVWTWAQSDEEIPIDKSFLVLGTFEGLQCWRDGQLVEEIIKKPNVPFEKSVDELNADTDKETWEEGINGPRPPWSHQFGCYLLDLDDGSVVTYLNSTAGAAMSIRQLKGRVKWMRKIRNNPHLLPIVHLGRQIVSKAYKKLGPDFHVVGWRDMSPTEPLPQSAVRQIAKPSTDTSFSVDEIGSPLAEPNMAEAMNDEMPTWPEGPETQADYSVMDAPQRIAEIQKENTAPAPKPAKKPAAASPKTTKRGVTKISARR